MSKYYYKIIANPVKHILPNVWDLVAILILISIFFLLINISQVSTIHENLGNPASILLSPKYLPYYALRSTLRMTIALVISIIFSLFFGIIAARSKRSARIIIPLVDICQSVPILGFLSISVSAFIMLFPHNIIGPELASIFAIFTSQAWNMLLSVYQSSKSIPIEYEEACKMMRLSTIQTIYKVQIPFTIPGLMWNMMMSLSGGWFFVVASEAIAVANQHIYLPGIGSYIKVANDSGNFLAIGYAIFTMFIIIICYDQLIFRPLLCWADKFHENISEEDENFSWVLALLQKTFLLKKFALFIDYAKMLWHKLHNLYKNTISNSLKIKKIKILSTTNNQYKFYLMLLDYLLYLSLIITVIAFIYFLVIKHLGWQEFAYVIYLGAITGLRVFILVILCSLIWVPCGIFIGLNRKIAQIAQPFIQFFASFPANLLFGLVAIPIEKYNMNVNIWATFLMIIGTQWYILFNVIAGTMAIDKETRYAAKIFRLKNKAWWQKFILPAIFPYYITGIMTAAGGAWNASIVAELITWKNHTFMATGLGSYIANYTALGDFYRTALGIGVMSAYVVIINKFVWQNLYDIATKRFNFA